MAIYIFVIILLVAFSAMLSGAEAAFLAVSDIRLRTLCDQGNKQAALVIKLKSDMRKLLAVILATQTASDTLASALATLAATKATGDVGVGIAAGVMTFITFIAVNLIPKSLAAANPIGWVLNLARAAQVLVLVFHPLVAGIDKLVSRLLPVDTMIGPIHTSEDDIRTMAKLAVQEGTVETGEREMIERVFLMNDITAFDVMTPGEEMVMLEAGQSIAETMNLVNSSGFSRYPVFRGEKSEVIGVLHIKDMFRRISDNPDNGLKTPVGELVEPAIFVPKTKLIDDLLTEFQKLRNHMALVVNEHGSIVGLVTLEDLLEELVGEIADESDVDNYIIKRIDKDTIIIHGEVEVKDVNRFLNTKIDAPAHKSLAWVVMKELGSIPHEGQKVSIAHNLTATVEEMINLKISKIRLDKDLEKEHNA
jgi:putative hemolysin